MSTPAAFAGSYADFKVVRSRKCCQIIVEIPIEQGGSFVAAFGMPNPASEIPVAIARLQEVQAQEAKQLPPPEKERRKWEDLPPSQQASIRCTDKDFLRFTGAGNADEAADYIRKVCRIASRSDLNSDALALKRWNNLDDDFTRWRLGATL